MDKLYEQFLFTKKSSSFIIFNILFYITVVISFMLISSAIMFLNIKISIIAVLMGAACYGFFRLKEKGYKEFEYTFINGNLEIDAIYNKKKRKKIFDEDVKNFDNFGTADQINVSREYKQRMCIPWDDVGEQYIILTAGQDKNAYYITPDENMVKLIQSYFIRRPRR